MQLRLSYERHELPAIGLCISVGTAPPITHATDFRATHLQPHLLVSVFGLSCKIRTGSSGDGLSAEAQAATAVVVFVAFCVVCIVILVAIEETETFLTYEGS